MMIPKCAKSGTDQYEALLEQRNTTRKDTRLSPVQMMLGRDTKAMIPQMIAIIAGDIVKREARKASVKRCNDRRTRKSPYIQEDQAVYFRHKQGKAWKKGMVKRADYPNCVIKSADVAMHNRHRIHLRPTSVPVHVRDLSPPRYENTQQIAAPTVQRQDPLQQQTNIPIRPTRDRRHPSYLKDYVQFSKGNMAL
ncbi:hypothetical protein DPMN_089671 [Dreissena polymorpha]|uniref:Uncharacterized protein n=1 Tax=Dreissena polymorpha TaxID=45954 RepID=A0A9D4QXJ1_DREPO|nr:hypothetical protein DPMN_089671 [Dreissena polymorpha]